MLDGVSRESGAAWRQNRTRVLCRQDIPIGRTEGKTRLQTPRRQPVGRQSGRPGEMDDPGPDLGFDPPRVGFAYCYVRGAGNVPVGVPLPRSPFIFDLPRT